MKLDKKRSFRRKMNMKNIKLISSVALIGFLGCATGINHKRAPAGGSTLAFSKSPDTGQIFDVPIAQAEQICASSGGHLPSIREVVSQLCHGTDFKESSSDIANVSFADPRVQSEYEQNTNAGYKVVLSLQKSFFGNKAFVDFYYKPGCFNMSVAQRGEFWTISDAPMVAFDGSGPVKDVQNYYVYSSNGTVDEQSDPVGFNSGTARNSGLVQCMSGQ
jgi:hypothetical protein